MSLVVVRVQDLPARLVGGCSAVLRGTSVDGEDEVVVSYHFGLTRESAHRRAVLAAAKILAKNLTARYST